MELSNLRIMVTGGAGFIGSHLVDRLIEMDNKIVIYDNLDEYYTGKMENFKDHISNPNFIQIKADILDYDALSHAMGKNDVVFHMAAQAGVRYSFEKPMKINNVNTAGTLHVLIAAKENGVKKVVFASSSSVYGNPLYIPIDENHPTNPISIYGASKLAAEKYCKIYNDILKIPTVILRFHTVYGPRQRPDMAFSKWLKCLTQNKSPSIYGDGEQTRDFTYISDIIDGTLKAAEIDDINGEIFNLGSGKKVSINYAIKQLIEAADKKDISPIYEKSKPGDVHDTYADISKAKKILGYHPKVPLNIGLKNYINWFSLQASMY